MMKNLNSTSNIGRLCILLVVVVLALGGVVFIGKTAVDNEFVTYENNPVMELGNPGEWDGGTAFVPNITQVEDAYFLFYSGFITYRNSASTIGYATSTNGLTWTKSISNPVLIGDGAGFDAFLVGDPTILVTNEGWELYYAGQPSPPPFPNNYQIGRATAPHPAGPWTRDDDPVLELGSIGQWDSGFILPDSVLKMADGYVMYYSGGVDFLAADGVMMGLATSPDGITWTKYDDPATTTTPFSESDPILKPGADGTWDSAMVWEGQVRRTNCGWELYYSGATSLSEGSIGYATSENGIHWVKDVSNPIYEAADDPVSIITGDIVESPTVIDMGNERWLYYDYAQGSLSPAVGLAKAPLSCQSTYLPLLMK